MHMSIRFFDPWFLMTAVIAASGCAPALKVSAVGISATAVAVEGHAMVLPSATAALPIVDVIVISKGGPQTHGMYDYVRWRGHSLNDNLEFPKFKLQWPPGKQHFRGLHAETENTAAARDERWRQLLVMPKDWNDLIPALKLNGKPQKLVLAAPSLPSGIRVGSTEQVARIVEFFNERNLWRRKPDPYQFVTRPGTWHLLIPQPNVAIYFIDRGKVIASRGLKGYELWAAAHDDSLYRILTIDEVRELRELGIQREVK